MHQPIVLYKGVTNTVELEFKNAAERLVSLTAPATIQFYDIENRFLFSAPINVTAMPNVYTASVMPEQISEIQNQYLKYYVVMQDGDNASLAYANLNFTAEGQALIKDGVVSVLPKDIVLDTFLMKYGSPRWYTSEAANIKYPVAANSVGTITLEVSLKNTSGTIYVDATAGSVISNSTIWETIDTFDVTSPTTLITQEYTEGVDFADTTQYLRVRYETVSTKCIDRVTIRF